MNINNIDYKYLDNMAFYLFYYKIQKLKIF